MTATAPLDPTQLPLRGIQLIEASAGTGKTWTIAALYVRAVLGHGGYTARWPAQILVVTFTRAATAELRQRIRERLAAAVIAFRTHAAADDSFLLALLRDYPNPADRAVAARRLELAAQWMDEAAIHTIHSWSQRMLAQHAFEGAQSIDLADTVDEDARLAQTVRDYWRRFYAPLDTAHAGAVLQVWKYPAQLQRIVQPLLREPMAQIRHAGQPLARSLELDSLLRQRDEPARLAQARARESWRGDAYSIADALRGAIIDGSLNKTSYPLLKVQNQLLLLDAWARGDDIEPSIAARYAQSQLRRCTNIRGTTPAHPAFESLDWLVDAWNEAPPLKPLLLAHALPWISEQLELARARQGKLGFDDMLRQLDAALEGAQGAPLAHAITEQYPLALIDEFQDTDPWQWHIFQRLYAARPDLALLLIGDPKQAIYSFRGADIHTYLLARKQAASPAWNLATNYRSTRELVGAVNRIFAFADTQPLGAFAFGKDDGGLSFVAVQANGSDKTLCLDDHALPALQFAVLPSQSPIPQTYCIPQLAAHAAAHLVTLLDAALADRCAFVDRHGTRLPLRPRDIAILVRNQREAAAMRQALRERGLSSVYLSDRDSVYASVEAADLLLWLRACAQPTSDRAMRAALATTSLHRTIAELDRLNHDELYAEQCVEQFRRLHGNWQRHGVLAMLHNLLHQFDLPARLLALTHGERALTNLLHLAELLQHSSTGLDGEQALIRYLGEQLGQTSETRASTPEEQIVRLESEADLIKVVTVYKAKGLQYPVVLLPFACHFKEKKKGDIHVWHDAQGEAQVELQASDAAWSSAERERLQEDLRLLYVALTRAEYSCWLGMAFISMGNAKASALHKSAIGYVLAGGEPIEPEQLWPRLVALRDERDAIVVSELPRQASRHTAQPRQYAEVERVARTYALVTPEAWWIASYSALAPTSKSSASRPVAPETPAQDVLIESSQEPRERGAATGVAGIHAFPRGAEPGTFLHGLLEWMADVGFAQTDDASTALEKEIARRCQRRGWQAWIKPLTQWLWALLHSALPLPGGESVALATLTDNSVYRAELEFLFEAHDVDTHLLDQLVARHTVNGAARPALPLHRINGMLRGFIDLIFEYRGRFYIVDYKSNWLGDDSASYTATAMRESILHARYDLQYAIYTLALHRQLRARLPDYDYARHMGGVVYLFVRGVDSEGHGVFGERLPRALVEAMDRLFAEGVSAHGA